ncbi:MAG: hypothetical protein IMHGJWDQ_001582 [Candidatus Fervidibacter sp.]
MALETRLRMTKEEFKGLPEGPPYYEYERGEVIEVSRPHPWHNFVLYLLASFLWSFVRTRDLGLVFMDNEVDLPRTGNQPARPCQGATFNQIAGALLLLPVPVVPKDLSIAAENALALGLLVFQSLQKLLNATVHTPLSSRQGGAR